MSSTQTLNVALSQSYLSLSIIMDEIASNATTERTRPTLPWPWGLVTGIFFALFLFTGIGGLLVAVFGKGFVHPFIPFYFQAVTTFIVIVLSIAETGLLVSAIRWVERTKQQQVTLIRSNLYSASGTQLSSMNQADTLSQREPRDFNVCHILLIYICLLGLNSGILLGFCCLTLILSYETQPFLKGYLWPFFVVDIVMSTTIPLVIAISLVPLAKLIRYITNGQIETRKVYRWCLPCLSYEQGTKDSYWVIDDCFYLQIGKSLCGGLNTLLVYVMSLMVFLNSWLYFINSILTTQYGAEGCYVLNERDKLHSYCYNFYSSEFGNPLHLNCSLNSSYEEPIFCMEFKSSTNLIQALVISLVLYYVMATCISVIFQIVRGLLYYSQTGMWSNLVILFGFLVLFLGGVGFVSTYYLHSNFDILSLLQLGSVCTCIVTVGILLKRGHPSFGRVVSKIDKDSIALTPANPSEFSVPVSCNMAAVQRAIEIHPPSIITDIQQETGSNPSRQTSLSPPAIPCNHHIDIQIEDTGATHDRQSSQIQPLENSAVENCNSPTAAIPFVNTDLSQNQNSLMVNSQVAVETLHVPTRQVEMYNSQTLPRSLAVNIPLRQRLSAAERPLSQQSTYSISSGRGQQAIHDGFATVGKRKVTIV